MGQESGSSPALCFESRASGGQGCPGKDPPALRSNPPIAFHSKHGQGYCLQQELVPGPQGEGDQQATPAQGSPGHRQMDPGRAGKCSSWERTWAEVCRKGCDTPPSPAMLLPACSCPPSPLPALCQQLKLPWCQQTIETYLRIWQSLARSTLGQRCCQGRVVLPGLCSAAGARGPGRPSPASCCRQWSAVQAGCVCLACHTCLSCRGHVGTGPCTSQPANLSVRNATCTSATQVPCPRSHSFCACCEQTPSRVHASCVCHAQVTPCPHTFG